MSEAPHTNELSDVERVRRSLRPGGDTHWHNFSRGIPGPDACDRAGGCGEATEQAFERIATALQLAEAALKTSAGFIARPEGFQGTAEVMAKNLTALEALRKVRAEALK